MQWTSDIRVRCKLWAVVPYGDVACNTTGYLLIFFYQSRSVTFQQLLVKEMERQSFLRRESCFKSLRLLVREVTLRCAMVSFNSCQAKNISQAKMTALKLCSIRYVNTRFWSLIIGKSSIVDIWNSFQNLDGYACLNWEFWRETDGFIGVLVWEQLGWFKVSDTRSYLSWWHQSHPGIPQLCAVWIKLIRMLSWWSAWCGRVGNPKMTNN